MTGNNYKLIEDLAWGDVEILKEAEKSYGTSWKQRGGVGAFMMLARKWDRLENQVKKHGWDVFQTALEDSRAEGILDDIGDLRRYLLLVESHIFDQMAKEKISDESTKNTV
tara:strand:- start:8010 stop:8342 length:333 start_codon:yes stop_codon:yes gene_type:complete